jgi:K+ transporter
LLNVLSLLLLLFLLLPLPPCGHVLHLPMQICLQLGFITFVYPCLMVTYWGQGSYLLRHPEHADDVFWKALPAGMFWPMFVAAILASVVASQASK